MHTPSARPFRGLPRPAPLSRPAAPSQPAAPSRPAILSRPVVLSCLAAGALGALGAFGIPGLPDVPALSHSRSWAPDTGTDLRPNDRTLNHDRTLNQDRTRTSGGSPASHAWSLPVLRSDHARTDPLTTRS